MSTNKQPYRADGGDISTGRLKEIAGNPYGDEEKCWLAKRVLALLDELEAAEKRIADLEGRTLVPDEPTLDQLVAGKRRLTSSGRMSRLMSQRLAEVYRAMVNAAAAGKGE